MRSRKLALVAVASLILASQTLAAPAELPPAGYAAPTYVDSTGCLYLNQGGAWVSGHSCGLIPSVPSARGAGVKRAERAPTPRVFSLPPGYQAAWTDDRLNPHRGPRTPDGQASMNRIWTDTVPMRRPTAGKAMRVQRNSARKPSKKPPPAAPPVFVPMGTGVAAPPPVLSTKGSQPAVTARYVQVGAFGVSENAIAVRDKLRVAGMQVEIRSETLGNRTLHVVLVGPLAGAAVANARQKVQGLGFGDAFLR